VAAETIPLTALFIEIIQAIIAESGFTKERLCAYLAGL
jgi:hypothetical protein